MDITSARIELTTRCNQKCLFCPRTRAQEPEPKIDMDLDYLKNCHNYKIVHLVSPRSEPALHPQFIDVINIFKERNTTLYLYSNMTTHTPQWWHDLGSLFQYKPDNGLYFSIDVKKHWKRYRGVNNWYKMAENVEAFTAGGGIAWAHMIEFCHNRDSRMETEELARTLGCERFRIKTSWMYDDKCSRPLGSETRWEQSNKSTGQLQCEHLEKKEVVIDAGGNITPCCFTFMNNEKKEILEEKDMIHLIKHKSCEVRGELKSLDTALDSKLFKYILGNMNTSWLCNLHCKKSLEESYNYEIRFWAWDPLISRFGPDTISCPQQFKDVDAGEKNRIKNKMWIIDELIRLHFLPTDYYNILTVGGWTGQMNLLLFPYVKSNLLTTDLDPNWENVCKQLGLKAETIDMFDIDYDPWDIIINTSCEHIDFVKWIESLKNLGKYMVLQSTNMPWRDHVNIVDSLEQFKEQADLSEIWYEGERTMDYYKYKRFLLIGVK